MTIRAYWSPPRIYLIQLALRRRATNLQLLVFVSRQHQLDQISHLIKRGLWLYVVFALLVAIPMFQGSLSAKITDVTLGLYGLIYHVLLVALFMGEIVQADINAAFMNTATLLIVVIIAMLINFKAAMASES
jgi:hypothetical protein